jgi:hypothetical protein
MLHENRIILEDSDMRRALQGEAAVKFEAETGWSEVETGQPTIFDAKARSLVPVLASEHPAVQRVELTSAGELSLILSGNVMIQTLQPKAVAGEAWRFFDRLGNHVVFP